MLEMVWREESCSLVAVMKTWHLEDATVKSGGLLPSSVPGFC